jgi:hemolysin activation/secretion protein
MLLVISALTAPCAQLRAAPVLAAAVIDGSTYSAAQLYSTYRDELGAPIDRAHALRIAAAVETLYERDGFSRPEVEMHDDLARDGILRVHVFEPRITRVALHGDAGPHVERIGELGQRLQASVPLRPAAMQQVLREMRALPGLEVAATTQRDGDLRNAYVLDVKTSYRPVETVLRFSNRGTDEIGPLFLSAQVVANDLLGLSEHLGVLAIAASDRREYRGAALFGDAPLNTSGTHLAFSGFRSASQPHEAPQDLPDDYRRTRGSLRLLQSLSRDFLVSATLEADDLHIVRDGSLLRDDRLRIVELGAQLAWSEGSVAYLSTVELRHGLGDRLGARLDARDLAVDARRGNFVATHAQLIRLQRFRELWTLRVDAMAQQSSNVLPYSERFHIGGDRLGRGFETIEIAGDSGAGAKVELRRDLRWDARGWGRPSVYGFSDYGAAWRQDAAGSESAATAGMGLALDGRRVHAYLEAASPITNVDALGANGVALFAEVSVNF